MTPPDVASFLSSIFCSTCVVSCEIVIGLEGGSGALVTMVDGVGGMFDTVLSEGVSVSGFGGSGGGGVGNEVIGVGVMGVGFGGSGGEGGSGVGLTGGVAGRVGIESFGVCEGGVAIVISRGGVAAGVANLSSRTGAGVRTGVEVGGVMVRVGLMIGVGLGRLSPAGVADGVSGALARWIIPAEFAGTALVSLTAATGFDAPSGVPQARQVVRVSSLGVAQKGHCITSGFRMN